MWNISCVDIKDISTATVIPASRLLTPEAKRPHTRTSGAHVVKAGREVQTICEEHRHAQIRYTRPSPCRHTPQGKPGEGAARPTPCRPIRYAHGPQGHRRDVSHLSRLPQPASGGALSTDRHRIAGLFCLGSVVHLWSEASQGVCPAQKATTLLHGYLCMAEF